MSGRLVAEEGLFKPSGIVMAEVEGLPPGAYVLQIETVRAVFSNVILSYGNSGDLPEIHLGGSVAYDGTAIAGLKAAGSTEGLVDMEYNKGDSLLFTAYLGEQQSEARMVPLGFTSFYRLSRGTAK
jgi:hypothetical protein